MTRVCRRCGEAILWARLDGRDVALDPLPHTDGTLRLVRTSRGGRVAEHADAADGAIGVRRYRAHRESCAPRPVGVR